MANGVARASASMAARAFALVAASALAAGQVLAADVEISADSGPINLDSYSSGESSIQVDSGVTVSGGLGTRALEATLQSWTITNDGTIQDADDIAIRSLLGGTVTNAAGATISGHTNAIVLGDYTNPHTDPGEGIVLNYGTIAGGGADAVSLWSGGTVTNYAGGSITSTSGNATVSLSGGTSRTIYNSGSISNTGSSTYSAGALIQGAAGSITNYAGGTIFGTANGIYASSSAPLTLINNGSITSTTRAAVEVDGGGTFTNTGTISSAALGMRIQGAATVTNSGTIASTGSGNAITFVGSAAHTLKLDTGSTLTGNVQGGTGTDNLVLLGSGTGAIAKFLSFETLAMQGTDWTLTGAGTFTTSGSVDAGKLSVNGTLTTANLSVLSGGVLGGGGTIHAVVANAGTIAPGNSIGTLTVDSVTFNTGSLFSVEIDPYTADKLVVGGAATIQPGVNVAVTPGSGTYSDGTSYLILDAGSITGSFAGISENSSFLDFALDTSIDPKQVWLTVTNVRAFPDVAETPNQLAAANGLQELGQGNPVYDAALMLDDDGARAAFDLLSGEIHATAKGAVLDDARFVREALLDRLRNRFDDAFIAPLGYAEASRPMPATGATVAFWGQGFASTGHFAGDGNAADMARGIGGGLVAADITDGAWRFGLAGAYQSAAYDVAARRSWASVGTGSVAAYGGFEGSPLAFRFGAALAAHAFETSRRATFDGYDETLAAHYGAWSGQVFGEAAAPVRFGGVTVEPFADLAHVALSTDAFSESGGEAALSSAASHLTLTFASLGARFAKDIPTGRGQVRLTAMAAWQHAFGDVTPTADLAFAGGTPFTVAGVPKARDVLRLEAGADWKITPAASVGIAYSGQIGAGVQDHGVRARFSVRF